MPNKLPFTKEQFLQIFQDYNQTIFPLQLLFYLLAFVIIYLSVKNSAAGDKIINFILAFFWMWMGVVYHLMFFSTINKAAYLFGSLFILQGFLFIYFGVIKQKLTYRMSQQTTKLLGALLVGFALFIYPLLGFVFGHIYPVSPTFGVPCPTTIFTFGVLLWSTGKVPVVLLIIPFLWSLLGFSAATTLGVKEDTALIISSFLTVSILLFTKQCENKEIVE